MTVNKCIDLDFNPSFNHIPEFYYFKADEFAHSAMRLEMIADKADQIWSDEFKKLGIKPGEIRRGACSVAMHEAELDRQCRNMSIYLLAHSLELLLKGLYIRKNKQLYSSHEISKIYPHVKSLIESPSFDEGRLQKLFLKLDQVCNSPATPSTMHLLGPEKYLT